MHILDLGQLVGDAYSHIGPYDEMHISARHGRRGARCPQETAVDAGKKPQQHGWRLLLQPPFLLGCVVVVVWI